MYGRFWLTPEDTSVRNEKLFMLTTRNLSLRTLAFQILLINCADYAFNCGEVQLAVSPLRIGHDSSEALTYSCVAAKDLLYLTERHSWLLCIISAITPAVYGVAALVPLSNRYLPVPSTSVSSLFTPLPSGFLA